jgi:hypothetical protein
MMESVEYVAETLSKVQLTVYKVVEIVSVRRRSHVMFMAMRQRLLSVDNCGY